MSVIKVDYGEVGGGLSGEHLAIIGGTANASSQYSSYAPSNAISPYSSSSWYPSNTGSSAIGSWISNTFPTNKNVVGIYVLYACGNSFPETSTWEVSDGTNKITEFTINQGDEGAIILFDKPVNCSTIKLTNKSASGFTNVTTWGLWRFFCFEQT